MSQVKCYELAVEHQLALQGALDEDDRKKFLDTLRGKSVNNIIVYTNQDPTIVSGYIFLLSKAIERWILGVKEEG
jgi:hypothetical protein